MKNNHFNGADLAFYWKKKNKRKEKKTLNFCYSRNSLVNIAIMLECRRRKKNANGFYQKKTRRKTKK